MRQVVGSSWMMMVVGDREEERVLRARLRRALVAGDRPAPLDVDSPARAPEPVVRRPLAVLGQIARYVLVGGLSTALNAVIFFVLRSWWEPLPATLLSLVLSTAASTEANRRFTFGDIVAPRWRVYAQGVGTVAFYAGYSTVVLGVLNAMIAAPTPLHETLAIATGSVLGGVTRFVVLRYLVFVASPSPSPSLALPVDADAGLVGAMTQAALPGSTEQDEGGDG